MKQSIQSTLAYLKGTLDKSVKGAGRRTITDNMSVDPADVRYARIPNANACDFCKMLGSRGFVYHSERKAGGKGFINKRGMDAYHAHCNCAIAVTFNPEMIRYSVGFVNVSRGYSGYNNRIVRTHGANPQTSMDEYDIDELFEQYQKMANSFTVKTRGSSALSHDGDYTVRLPGGKATVVTGANVGTMENPFESLEDMTSFISEANTLKDLERRSKILDSWWDTERFPREWWWEVYRQVQEMKKAFKE